MEFISKTGRIIAILLLISAAAYAANQTENNTDASETQMEATINIATDSSQGCSCRPVTPGTFKASAENPLNIKKDCELELELLTDFLSSETGEALVRRSKFSLLDASKLEPIQDRIRELEKICSGENKPRDLENPARIPAPSVRGSIVFQFDSKAALDAQTDTGEKTVAIHLQARSSAMQPNNLDIQRQRIKLLASATTNAPLPIVDTHKQQGDYGSGPVLAATDRNGQATLRVPASYIGLESFPGAAGSPILKIEMDTTIQESINAEITNSDTQSIINALPQNLLKWMVGVHAINGKGFLTFTFPASLKASVSEVLALIPGVVQTQTDFCRRKQEVLNDPLSTPKQRTPNDPLFTGNGAWGQNYDNQWAIKHIRFGSDEQIVWNSLGKDPKPVTVAIIDTGLDWNHPDIDPKNIWHNHGEIPDNQLDDDGNGYVDDYIGWDFISNHNRPWDHDGHGTLVAGVIAATANNSIGITGINPHARIMVLKALNDFGNTRASYLAKAIVYAIENGARIINIGAGGSEISTIELEAIQYAIQKNVLVIIGAGNEETETGQYGIAGFKEVLTVGATGLEDEWLTFSNWGQEVDIAAPGIDILSLRARHTDTMREIMGVQYTKNETVGVQYTNTSGDQHIGEDRLYCRAGGTSVSASIVTGVASLLYSRNPNLTVERAMEILETTAEDIELTGFDPYTGHGLINASAALGSDVDFYMESNISGFSLVESTKGPVIQVRGTALANDLSGYRIDLGISLYPETWKLVAMGRDPVRGGVLGTIDAGLFKGAVVWLLRLTVLHKNGATKEYTFELGEEELNRR